ncbi:protein-L-isoaspartate(D-aspartate) O-methyltransferase [Natronobiforma cellulositropha]|uniref:protein-L-isoaspartate(D-aspartate) O-methyltransferase n=1 Tax=Natronobiforma cellulositropha TaxID=1679076 RepID=UPI0021D5B337|nr:protein-L-isoaspartate(D-aspartate) O-methyltransferase [Natronobiforma cellulositropha]
MSDPRAEYRDARERMAATVARGRGIDSRVREALAAVPRHAFVPSERRERAYEDLPLPIGDGQTISAPHMVAVMADLLALERGDAVLEVGTGCGYHAAVTAELVGAPALSSVEYSADLAERARATLERLGYGAVSVRVGDGREGWPDRAPFDAIYLTCAVPDVPDALLEQLGPGGRLLAPVGTVSQRLVSLTRREDGTLEHESHGGVRFVTMRG